ncbi:putative NADH dehydrogenase [ubiquinone] 1 alpha subcomplex subunit 1-like [Capsicum annuum]|nr:putative NADH dehydrogenase [ubiquinone] 1 alpha subcomplex subunit 1-like [Capsicum annuum]
MTSPENNASTPRATATSTVDGGVNAGLIISTTETIRSFLAGASSEIELSDDLKKLASSLSDHQTVTYKHLRSIWVGSDPSTRPDLMRLLSGSNFVLCSPKPREKSEELKARLRKLEEALERKAYDELVKDITPKKAVDEPFSSYKDQMGFGLNELFVFHYEWTVLVRKNVDPPSKRFLAKLLLDLLKNLMVEVTNFSKSQWYILALSNECQHTYKQIPQSLHYWAMQKQVKFAVRGLHVALTMFTGYLVGYYAFRALFSHSPAMSAAGGILGLVIGMLVETLLFIIRTSSIDKKPARKATSFTTKQKKNQ